ncbi:MAG: hypothetical protein V2I35_05405 [Desulfocapsaceae bacterium]|jgi:UTP-glucose-1-phosphate uridylyltransferase|nr:hypothetical protein [Desulfocapsaceae bacterium]
MNVPNAVIPLAGRKMKFLPATKVRLNEMLVEQIQDIAEKL